MRKSVKRMHAASDAAAFLLLGVFALFSVTMVLFSAGVYKNIRLQSDSQMTDRILDHYVANTVRAHDRANAVSVGKRSGVQALILSSEEDGAGFETIIYWFDGAVREIFLEENSGFDPQYGEIIAPARAFSAEISEGLLSIVITDGDGREKELNVALRTRQEEASI